MSEPSALRLLGALAWLRWRLVLNAITRSGARDFLERLSRSAESVLPIAVLVVVLPAALALAAVGAWAGWAVARGDVWDAALVEAVRWSLAATFVMTLFGPLIFASTHQASGTLRLLLLPIPRRVLYLAQVLGPLADPWIFLTLPMLLSVVAGLAAGGAVLAALVALAAAAAMIAVLLGVSALVNTAVQLVVRNRRRAELFVLGGTLFIIVVSLVPSAFIEDRGDRREAGRPDAAREERSVEMPRWVAAVSRGVPSEAYTAVVRHGRRPWPEAAGGLAVLGAWALLTHGLTWPIFRRLLQTPATSGRARGGPAERAFGVALPGAGPVVSAVAVTFARLAFRTPRGRTLVLAPIVMLALFAFLSVARGATIPFGPARLGGGFSLAIFGIGLSILSLGPFMFNQFAVDRSGLTLQFLAPVSVRELLYGKAIGGALIAAAPLAVSILAGLATGARAPLHWASLLVATCAVYAIFAPVAAILSLLFPRTVDLSSIGQASNAHQAAGLLGLVALAAIAAPPSLLAAVSLGLWASPVAALGLETSWLAAALAIAFLLFRVAERLVEARKENLLLVALGR